MSVSPAFDPVLDQLAKYVAQGFALLPLWGVTASGECRCPKGASCEDKPGKHPLNRLVPNGVKLATRDMTLIREWYRRYPDANWGVRCGEALTGGGFLACLDIDPRNGGDVSITQLPPLPLTVMQETGRGDGGMHVLVKTSSPIAGRSVGPGLDLIGAGKYFVVHPSMHESGGQYVWALGQGLDDVAIAEAPEWLLEGGEGKAGGRPPRVGEGTARDTVMGEAFALAEMLGVELSDGTVAVKCPWHEEHSDARGRGQDSSTVILPPAGGSLFGQFKCMHAHCSNRKWHDVLAALPVSAVEAAKVKFPLRPMAVVEQEAADAAEPMRTKDPMQDLRERLSYKTSKGGGYKLVNDIVNAITILTYDPRWKDKLQWDEFAQVLKLTSPPPWHPDDAPKVQEECWTDDDVTRLDAWFRRYWALELKETGIGKAAHVVGRKNSYHPLRAWMESLVWDKKSRLDAWLSTYLGALDNPYTQFVGSKWMISAVARVLQPGCKADHLMVLEGAQGKGKSTALRVLAGGQKYFSDTPIDIGNKDAFVSLRGKLIIELAELASTSKADADKVKAFFSSPADSYRPPYGRELVTVPRSCVFAGTVNHKVYLRDETGNRRYWPVECGVIDIKGLEEDREQLWAEAVERYKRGERWWPEFKERAMIEEAQGEREETDVWEIPIAKWLASDEAKKILSKQGAISTNQILEQALGIEVARAGRSEQMRIAGTLNRMGYQRVRLPRDAGRGHGFRPTI
jgi:predicted P-loop ATPase